MNGCVIESQYERDSKLSPYINSTSDLLSEGQILHFVDNFDYNNKYSMVMDEMESLSGFMINGEVSDIGLSNDFLSGNSSISFIAKPYGNSSILVAKRTFDEPLNLYRWTSTGVFSCWIKLENAREIAGVRMILFDNSSSCSFIELVNLQGPPNELKINGFRPDYFLPKQNNGMNMWMDYQLVNGWNYIFWDTNNHTGNINMEKVLGYQFEIRFYDNFYRYIILDDFRVQDGLQIENNPTGGKWYSPLGMPMYGVFDADIEYLRLLNVRQTQYISNGDHVRILSNAKTPINFTMKIIFSIDGIKNDSQSLVNNYVRFAWDFDNEYDPGHDAFIAFMSLQYAKFGLLTVYHIKRYFVQGQEPTAFSSDNRVTFFPKENQKYEIDITTIGQHTEATIYSINGFLLQKQAHVEYTFQRERNTKRYPISIEATGNIHLNLYKVEVLNLSPPSAS